MDHTLGKRALKIVWEKKTRIEQNQTLLGPLRSQDLK